MSQHTFFALFDALRKRQACFARSEQGGIIIFTLFILVMLIMIAGVAVDTARYEARRVAMQNTIDSAVLAASSLTQDKDGETIVRDYVAKAGFDPDDVKVTPVDRRVNGGALVGRAVMAESNVAVDTNFMDMLGVPQLQGIAGSVAAEGIQNIEISLIVDISGSMGRNDRMKNLKVAAKQFVRDMLDPSRDAGTTSISIIPYNATVVVGNDILKHLNASGVEVDISDQPQLYSGQLQAFRTVQTHSTCVRFYDDQFDARAITPLESLDRVSHFYWRNNSNGYDKPEMWQRWCNESRSSILAHSNSVGDLEAHIEGLSTGGWTGIDNGMKWGVALLDPAFSPVIKKMIDENQTAVAAGLPPVNKTSDMAIGRPGQYNKAETRKIIVLMTDGANTYQRDLKDEFKNGPSPVWQVADDPDTAIDEEAYYVLMPDNSDAERFYVPGDPSTGSDDTYITAGDLPPEAEQMDYIALHDRFAYEDIASYFFQGEDAAAYSAHNSSQYKTEEGASIDERLQEICKAAKINSDITVYTIGFEAPEGGQKQMRDCATKAESENYYFNTNGVGISGVFAAIAADIQKLRLTY